MRSRVPAMTALALVTTLAQTQAKPVAPAFSDRSAALPVEHVYAGGWEHFVGGGVAVFDCNSDRMPDLFTAGGTNVTRLFVNETEVPGGPVAFRLGTDAPTLTGVTGAYPINIDGDAHIDLIVLRVGENVILRGLGDCIFDHANEAFGFDGGSAWSTSFTATWEAEDGLPTLFVGSYVDRDDPDGPFEACDANALFRPDQTGKRYDAPIKVAPGYCALSALISDERRTGRRDLRISNDRHYYVRGGSEQKLRLDTLEFLDEDDGWPTVSLWGMGIAARDITGDGRAEVMSTSMGDQLLQIATDAGYENAPFSIGTYAQKPFIGDDGRPSTGWHAQFGDVNNDGRDDLFIAKGNVDQMPSNAIEDPNNLLVQQTNGTFIESAGTAGVATTHRARGAALADLNRDGRLDLVVMNRRAAMEVYENRTGDTGNWLSIAVKLPNANTDAIGATIEVSTPDGKRQTREITIGGGHAGGTLGAQHFGLGEAREVQVKIISPNGLQTHTFTAGANTHVATDLNEVVVYSD
ncbi:MAG: CRTAC1 family protein [Pseudomonadota bacterium]